MSAGNCATTLSTKVRKNRVMGKLCLVVLKGNLLRLLDHDDEGCERGAVVIDKLSVRTGIADAHMGAGDRAERRTVLDDLTLGIVYGDTMYIGSTSEATSPWSKACDTTGAVTGVKHLRLLLLQEEDP